MENKMGTEKISRLVLTTGIPLMLSLLINSLYNFVDSVFVSRVAEDALTALSLSAPVQVFVSALGLGNAVGLNAAISKALGENRPDKVKKTASAAIFIAVRWMALAWMISIPNLVVSSSLQGLSMPRPSMVLTMLRQAVLPVLFALALTAIGNVGWVWLAFAVSEIICIPLALRMWNKSLNSIRSQAADKPDRAF